MIREDDYDEDGELDNYSLYEYDASGLKVKQSVYDGDGTLFYVAEYGKREKILRETETYSDYTWTAEYNALGGCIKELFSDSERALAIHETIDTHVNSSDRLAICLQLVESETNLRANEDNVSLRSFVRCFTQGVSSDLIVFSTSCCSFLHLVNQQRCGHTC
jgi:hypothetical protein